MTSKTVIALNSRSWIAGISFGPWQVVITLCHGYSFAEDGREYVRHKAFRNITEASRASTLNRLDVRETCACESCFYDHANYQYPARRKGDPYPFDEAGKFRSASDASIDAAYHVLREEK